MIFTPASPEQYFLLRGAFLIYEEALKYVKNIERAGSDYGIERMRKLLVLLGEPDRALKFVHVAGTNGKGSVTAYLTQILFAAGYKVGTYNSPSVFLYNERWLIDGAPLCDADVAEYLTEVREVIEKEQQTNAAFCPTAFEIETAVAFLAFKDKNTNICVLETGLGGRWDATNVIYDKLLAVITPIGLDHCALLGNTLAEIASEKAAIIRGDAVTCVQCDEVMNELRHPRLTPETEESKCKLTICSAAVPVKDDIHGQTFEYDGKTYDIRMLGAHQLVNASLAVEAARALRSKGFDISDEAVSKGLKNTVWRARFQVIRDACKRLDVQIDADRTLVLDGAHNPHGARALAYSLRRYFAGKRINFVLGILADKDVDGILRELLPLAARVTAVSPPSERALVADELCRRIQKLGVPCKTGADIVGAVKDALTDGDVTVLCGSLTLFGNFGGLNDK